MTTPLQAALNHIDDSTSSDEWQLAALCRGLVRGYDHRWLETQQDIELLDVEIPVHSPLRNTETGQVHPTWNITGIVDKIAKTQQGKVLFDHKTTSEDISDPTGQYWRRLAVDTQAPHYELILLQNGINLDNVIWDVVRKPKTKPKTIKKADRDEAMSSSVYCGFDLDNGELGWLYRNHTENGSLFEKRIFRDCICQPEKYFARRSNNRTGEELLDYADDLWKLGNCITQASENGEHFKNPASCVCYGSVCEYLNLCSNLDSPDSQNWIRREKPADLPPEITSSDSLSTSRLKTFHACRRKHYYKYELQIERIGKQRQEALYFGSLFHQALDVWWTEVNNRRLKDDSSSQGPISCIGQELPAAYQQKC